MQIKLGCDPEAFLQTVSGQLKSSIGLIGGSKECPLPIDTLGDGYAVQEDNVAIEFNIPPASGRSQFVESIQKTLDYLAQDVGARYGLTFSRESAASFPETELQDPRALVFGCDPDFNAWTEDVNPKPAAVDKTLRSCGGHVHIGYPKRGIKPTRIIQFMDLFTGVPSVLMDKGERRKQLYGKAGAFRDKSYGVEYRTLSNFWIFHPRLIEWVWDNTNKAVLAAKSKVQLAEDDANLIQNCINNNDKGMAESLVKKFNLEVVHV